MRWGAFAMRRLNHRGPVQAIGMEYDFFATRDIQWTDLRFPFPLRWRMGRGFHSLCAREGAALIRRAGEVQVKAEQLFDVSVAPDETGAVTGRIMLCGMIDAAGPEPDWPRLLHIYTVQSGVFGLALTQSMFQLPRYPWNMQDVAAQLHTEPRELQMMLFRQCYSFCAALRRCRALNKLLTMSSKDVQVSIATGADLSTQD